ncbi:MAG TPA: DUF1501 domain-containing protein [Planctomycetes bacterium]|nr:DUF1501 domain-containing protein [Planctomycetota bacterium]HIN81168.1 DUF1501 domain-containing protein [Planctomycetota bacterium]
MQPELERDVLETRRQFFGRALTGVGSTIGLAALSSLENSSVFGASPLSGSTGVLGAPHFTPKAKRVIYLFMSGAPSQLDLFDYKPKMEEYYDKDLPETIRDGQRLTTMTSKQARFPIAPSIFKFKRYGPSGAWFSDLLPHTAAIADRLCIVKSMYTEAINHDPAITFIQTGSQQPGRPSMGAWLSYGLGSINSSLPAFVVMQATWTGRKSAQALFNRLWGAGFLSAEHQGVTLRSIGDPVLYLSNPPGVAGTTRRAMLDRLARLNRANAEKTGDPETHARIAQYEMAYRMQSSVPELVDISGEPQEVLDMYGPEVTTPGTFAASCLKARRLIERDVRFVQIFHRGWDQHGTLPKDIRNQCSDVDQPTAGLIRDLEQRGLLDDTLVIWGGEFGRTIYCQGALSKENYGRDHHPRCFTIWMAGAGVKAGLVHGETDDFSYNITRDPVHIHDFNATILHLLGIDHERLIFPRQGRDFRITDVHGKVIQELLA